jgi:hypothetical protein
LEKTTTFHNNILFEEQSKDFISSTLFEEDYQIKEDIKKRKITLIGLGSLYVILVLVSLTLLA